MHAVGWGANAIAFGKDTMSFDVERVSYELIAALRPLLPRSQRRDRALARRYPTSKDLVAALYGAVQY